MFIVFAYDCYYPNGGSRDIQGVFDNIDDARNLYDFILKMGRYWDMPDIDPDGYISHYDYQCIYDVSKEAIVVGNG